MAGLLVAQTTPRVGGSQTRNTQAADPAATSSTTDASGTAHVVIKAPAAAKKSGSKAASTASHRDESKPLNDTLPTDPMQAVELSPLGFDHLVLHREPCVMDPVRDKIHTRGPVVIDVHLDQSGAVDQLDYIGPPDLGEACMEAVKGWKFAPYTYHGQPWRVGSWIRFEFASPYQRSAVSVIR